MNDDETRLRVAQARPTSLRAVLGTALEIESFSLAARRRARPVRTVRESPTKIKMESYVDPLEDTVKRNTELRQVAKSVNRVGKNQTRSPPRGKRKCWTCGSEDHLQRDCRLYSADEKRSESGNEEESSPRGGVRR